MTCGPKQLGETRAVSRQSKLRPLQASGAGSGAPQRCIAHRTYSLPSVIYRLQPFLWQPFAATSTTDPMSQAIRTDMPVSPSLPSNPWLTGSVTERCGRRVSAPVLTSACPPACKPTPVPTPARPDARLLPAALVGAAALPPAARQGATDSSGASKARPRVVLRRVQAPLGTAAPLWRRCGSTGDASGASGTSRPSRRRHRARGRALGAAGLRSR